MALGVLSFAHGFVVPKTRSVLRRPAHMVDTVPEEASGNGHVPMDIEGAEELMEEVQDSLNAPVAKKRIRRALRRAELNPEQTPEITPAVIVHKATWRRRPVVCLRSGGLQQ